MKKNDIAYEYRVFTNRLIDVGCMEVGNCTSKVVKDMKPNDKVDGRFFHTSDTDEWFFCWKGELQKLNLKGNADINAALKEVEKLIADANDAVELAKVVANNAKDAADEAKIAADAASAAVENIENKADKSEVEAVSQAVEEKADKTVVKELTDKVNAIQIPSLNGYATEDFVIEEIAKLDIPELPTKVSQLENDANYLTEHQDITGKQDVIDDLSDIRSGAALGATSLQSIPDEYITETELNNKGYLTSQSLNGYATEDFVSEEISKIDIPTKISKFENDSNYLTSDIADLKYAPINSEGVDLSDYATKDFVGEEIKKIDIPTKVSELENDANYLTEHQDITGKQDTIDDLNDIRSNAEKGATALESLSNYFTKEEINTLIGEAVNITNTILA